MEKNIIIDIPVIYPYGWYPMLWAIKVNSIEMIQFIIDYEYKNNITSRNNKKNVRDLSI